MRAPDSLTFGTLAASELWRRGARRVKSGPLYRWRFSSNNAAKIISSPLDLRPGNSELARNYYGGQFTFAGETVETNGSSPFTLEVANTEWMEELHNFRWLRHLRAANSELAKSNAVAHISDWIDLWGTRHQSYPWHSEIVAKRLIAWLSHGQVLFQNRIDSSFRKYLKSTTKQTRYLQYNAQHTRDGYPRLLSYIALAFSGLCIDGSEKILHSASKLLARELARQILPDGGHISRNPIVLLELLADLIPLSQLYQERGYPPSPELISAIDRMTGALKFFKHNNDNLAQFNGVGQTPSELLARVLSFDETSSSAPLSMPHSGYERLQGRKTTVIMDTGRPVNRATATNSMAGTLSFELTSGATRFITNCGVSQIDRSKYIHFARATAAHSTVTVEDTSSSRYAGESRLHQMLPSSLVHAPSNVSSSRQSLDGFNQVTASHNGYEKNFCLIHERELNLSTNGNQLNGIDRLITPPNHKKIDSSYAIRFHLPPQLSASKLSSGYSILIAAPNGDAWTFSCVDAPIGLEESIYFSGPEQPRKTEQIVVYGTSSQHQEIRWTFERRQKASNERNRRSTDTPVETPDLLDALNIKADDKKV